MSHNNKLTLKMLQVRLQQYVNCELPDVQDELKKAEEPEIKSQTSAGSLEKQESARKNIYFVLLTMPKPMTVWITTNFGKLFKKLTCLMRNLYAGQEATVRT